VLLDVTEHFGVGVLKLTGDGLEQALDARARDRAGQARAIPLLDDMKRWFDVTPTTLSVKSDTTKAIQYALNRWPSLIVADLLLQRRGRRDRQPDR
jgi:hypothetical protein